MEKVLNAVGCREGIAWMQVMLDEDGKFYIIEMGYRLDGDMMYIPFKGLLGFDTTAWLVDYALGKVNTPAELPKPQEHTYRRCASSYMLWTNKGGTIASIEGLDEIAAIPGIYVDSLARVGDEVHKYMPLGDILFDTDTIDETFDIIRRVNDTVSIKNTIMKPWLERVRSTRRNDAYSAGLHRRLKAVNISHTIAGIRRSATRPAPIMNSEEHRNSSGSSDAPSITRWASRSFWLLKV